MAPHDDLTDDDPPVINPYEVLELERGADEKQVKSAYRKAALRHHPGTPQRRPDEIPLYGF